jgi:hypothetical protein
MPWKIARWSLAGLACLAVLAGARADEDEKPKEKKKEIKITLPEPYAKAAKACQECMKAIGAAGKVAAEKYKEGEKQYLTPLRWMQDAQQCSQLTLFVIIRNGPALKLVGETCAKVCDECAKACKDFEEDELKECAKQCTACAKAVRDLLKGAKPAKKDDKKAKDGEKAAFRLSVPADVTIKQGGEATITVKLARMNFDDEVALEVSDLPKGVAVKDKDLKVKKGATSAKITLLAEADADATEGHDVTVTGKSGELEARARLKLTVKAKD